MVYFLFVEAHFGFALKPVLAFVLIVPSVLVQLGVSNEVSYGPIIIGVSIFLFICTGSGYAIYRFSMERIAFSDEEERNSENQENEN